MLCFTRIAKPFLFRSIKHFLRVPIKVNISPNVHQLINGKQNVVYLYNGVLVNH